MSGKRVINLNETVIKLLQFGAPIVQQQYKDLCKTIGLSFDDFQLKLIEDTGKSYDELKTYLICGEEVPIDSDTVIDEDFLNTNIDNYLIIHFDTETKDVVGIIVDDLDCLYDGFDYFIQNIPNPVKYMYTSYLDKVIWIFEYFI